jgi:GNAT superfamily N-acetyltransferase
MMFWHEVDGALLRESAKMAGPVRQSIEAQVDIDEIIRQWNLSYPKGAEVTKAEARAWAKVHIKVDNTELNKGLGILYAIGWIFGRDVATSAYAHARLNKAAPTDEQLNGLLNIDWANWTPGNNPGALLAAPPGGLKGLLQRRGLDLQGLTNTLLNRIGTHLADALMSGASDTMLGKMLETVVGDPERALTIANTSMASAMSVSTRETYQEFGLAKMRWLALEPCSTCSGNGAMGPVTPGEAVFKNVQGDNITEPPAHPNCRCALAPVIDLDQFKYVGQPRDDAGRWTSGGAGSAPAALEIPENQRMASEANLVSATAPYVGLSPKAQAIAARISDVQHKPEMVGPDGRAVIEHTATYTAKDGTKAKLVMQVHTNNNQTKGGVEVSVDGVEVGGLLYDHVSGGYADLFSVPVAQIRYVTIKPEYRGLGLGTAALEFARSQDNVAILHSKQLTAEGREFAESTKTVEQ